MLTSCKCLFSFRPSLWMYKFTRLIWMSSRTSSQNLWRCIFPGKASGHPLSYRQCIWTGCFLIRGTNFESQILGFLVKILFLGCVTPVTTKKKATINAARNAIKGCHSLPWSQNTTPRCLDHRPPARTDEAGVSRGVLDWEEVYICNIHIYAQAHTLCVWYFYYLFTDLYTRPKMHTHIMYTYLPFFEMAWYRHFACLAWLIHIDAWILTLSLQVPCGISSITPMD